MAIHLVVLDPYSSDGWVSEQELDAVVGAVGFGSESRVQRAVDFRRNWQIPFDSMDHAQRVGLRSFHRLRRGVVYAFLLWDTFECYAAAQPIGTGDGVTKAFQLATTISDAAATLVRTIRYPVPSGTPIPFNLQGWAPGQTTATTTVTVGGTARADFTVAAAGGVLTFTGSAPPAGAQILATFWHYTPVRFMDKKLSFAHRSIKASSTPAIIEVLGYEPVG